MNLGNSFNTSEQMKISIPINFVPFFWLPQKLCILIRTFSQKAAGERRFKAAGYV